MLDCHTQRVEKHKDDHKPVEPLLFHGTADKKSENQGEKEAEKAD